MAVPKAVGVSFIMFFGKNNGAGRLVRLQYGHSIRKHLRMHISTPASVPYLCAQTSTVSYLQFLKSWTPKIRAKLLFRVSYLFSE